MKKKVLIILIIFLAVFVIIDLYQTYATNTTVTVDNNIYNFNVLDNETLTIPAKSSKTVIYQICNTNDGTVQYGVGYTSASSDIVVKYWWDSLDPAYGTINYGENKFVKLKITNHGTTDADVSLNTVLGYEHGGSLVAPSNVNLVTNMINEHNYVKLTTDNYTEKTSGIYLGDTLSKEYVGTLTFVDNNIVPAGNNYKTIDISKDGDGTVMLWYYDDGTEATNGKYDVYIGSDNGKTSIETGESLFYSFSYTTSFDLSKLDTSQVTTMKQMFENCNNLISLDLSSFDTSSVTNMYGMFYNCAALTLINLEGFNTSSVTNMSYMFGLCDNLTTLDLSSFYTPNLESIIRMFNNCTSLQNIDMSNFDFSSVTSYDFIFNNVPKTVKIYIDVWQRNWWSRNIQSAYDYMYVIN